MFDAWNLVGVGGGSAALTWLAAGPKKGGETTLRLSLDKSNSLVGDVRFIGAALCWVASMYTNGKTKKTLQTVTAASAFSLLQTEMIRMQLKKQNPGVIKPLPTFPSYGANALPGPHAQNANYQYAPQGAWAGR